jgi:glycosyltransferase involved in cell wall biosynthesis
MAVQLVSILIPCYNAERWLAETLESAMGQTWAKKEIIVVDDGSTDNSRKILKSFKPRGLKVLEQENRGASAARNRALSQAQGEFIQFLDADDLIAPDKIEIQMNRLSESDPGCLAFGAWGRFYDSSHNTKFVPEPIWKDLLPVDWLITSWSGGWMMASHSWLTPRGVIEKAGSWDETPSPIDDGEFFTRVILSSSKVLFCPLARSYYRSGIAGSWSQRRTHEMLVATFRSIELSTQHVLGVENNARTRRASASHFQQFIYDIYPDHPDLLAKAEDKVASLGGSDHKLMGGGRVFRTIANTFGWKTAKQIQALNRKLRHN